MIAFRRLRFEDLPLMHRWINEDPVVNQIWVQGETRSLEQITNKYGPRINGEQPTDPYLILAGETPIGYIQTYLWQDYDEDFKAHIDLTDAASFDVFIGEAAYRYRGIGQEILSRFMREYVFARPEVKSCIITPLDNNPAGIRAYEKLGFRHVATIPDLPGEPAPVYFMRIDREQVMAPCNG